VGLYERGAERWLPPKPTTWYTPLLEGTYGTAADLPLSSAIVPVSMRENHAGDFDGDFISDLTVYNTTSGAWDTLTSSTNFAGAMIHNWGGTGYTPVPADYHGAGQDDMGLY